MTDELHQLRRRLRAMSTLNHQLRGRVEGLEAQLAPPAAPPQVDPLADPPPSPTPTPLGAAPRRGRTAGRWDLTSPLVPVASLDLVVAPDGARYVLEAGRRRRIRAGLLVPALEAHLGPTRPATPEETADLAEGPPVEVLESTEGPPFVILGGQRLPLRHLPLPHPIAADLAEALPEGPVLDLAPPLVREPPPATLGARIAKKGGPVKAAEAAGRKAARTVRRAL